MYLSLVSRNDFFFPPLLPFYFFFPHSLFEVFGFHLTKIAFLCYLLMLLGTDWLGIVWVLPVCISGLSFVQLSKCL